MEEEKHKFKAHIEGRLYLEADKYQFIIKKYNNKKDKDGNYGYSVTGYPDNLGQFGKWMLKEDIKASTAKDIRELIEVVKQAEDRIVELFGDIKAKVLNYEE